MTAPIKHPICAVDVTAQPSKTVAAKAFDRLLQMIGPRKRMKPAVFQCGAPWTGFADDDELRRLACLQGRIVRREEALRELRAERSKIMMRCIRRMRRDRGVE